MTRLTRSKSLPLGLDPRGAARTLFAPVRLGSNHPLLDGGSVRLHFFGKNLPKEVPFLAVPVLGTDDPRVILGTEDPIFL